MILAELLRQRGLESQTPLAYRNSLDPRDIGDGRRTIADLAATGHDLAYARMQDSRRFGQEADVLCFTAEPNGLARLRGFRRFVARRPGIVPGDIVYDYDIADLLHDFAARAKRPFFYDSFELDGLDDAFGNLVIRWPAPLMIARRPADHPGLIIEQR